MWLPATRRAVLDELADAEGVLAAGTGPASLLARLRWRSPRRPANRERAVGWALDEAAHLGVTGLGGVSSYARALLRGESPVAAARAAAALAGRPRAGAGRPHRGRARSARGRPGPPALAARRRGVARRGHRLPVRGRERAARLRRRLVGGRDQGLPARVVAHAGAAVAGLPRRRRLAALRHGAGGRRGVVPAQRRRDRAHLADARPGGGVAAAAPDRADGRRLRRAAPRAAAPAAGHRRRAGGRVRRRHRAGGPARRVPVALAPRTRWRRPRPGPSYRPHDRARRRHPLRRPGGRGPAARDSRRPHPATCSRCCAAPPRPTPRC